jgi:hypothetical protein
MNRLFLAAGLAAGCTLASSAPALAAPRNFDCTKPANANKSACKAGTAKPAAPKTVASKPAPKPAAAPKAVTTKTVTRSYDCTKAGNANKAQCKSSTSVATSVTKAAPPAAKPGIFQRMSNVFGGIKAAPAAAPRAPRRTASAAPASVEDHNPAGAIAQCKDGTYSHAKGRTGACSRHGGVGKWS